MARNKRRSSNDLVANNVPFIMEGQVVATDDPSQMGRLKVWVPALDGDTYDVQQLPWTEYASPLAGYTVDYPAGQATKDNLSHVAYGFFAVPKIGATVLVFCLNGDPSCRFYFACTTRLQRNRSLPAGRNNDAGSSIGPWGDAGDPSNLNPVEPAYSNLREQFQDKVDADEALSRGVWERTVAQGITDKDGKDGYSPNPMDSSTLDPQTYCLVSPGRHAFIMQDDPYFARVRIKTAEGHQIILDDANERIYISTAKGKTWIELDLDGRINIFGASDISVRTGGDFNVFADGSINLEATKEINLKAVEKGIKILAQDKIQVKSVADVLVSACGNFHIDSEKTLYMTSAKDTNLNAGAAVNIQSSGSTGIKAGDNANITSSSDTNINAGGNINEKGSKINLNSGGAAKAGDADKAECAELATDPPIVPGHEPWVRPDTKGPGRGPTWSK